MTRKTLVLIADGNVQRARTLADHLESLGCEVALASSGHQAHRDAADRKPDAIVADWGLSEMNGLELARQVTLGRLGAKVVLLRDDPDWPSLGRWVSMSLTELFKTEDHREGVKSFLEKRPAVYVGR